jgi:diadenylate cyclase
VSYLIDKWEYLRDILDPVAWLEIGLIYVLIYYFIKFCEGTRGAGVLKGLALLVLMAAVTFRVITEILEMDRLGHLLDIIGPATLTALVVILQPELRRGLVRLSQTPIFGEFIKDEHEVLGEVIKACFRLAKNKVGALIAIEREQSLNAFAERGTRLDSEVRSELITTLFYPGTELHDGAIVVQKGRIAAAGCLFPLSENPELGSWAGTRHRAGVGITEESDCVTVVVSEETGHVSLCIQGKVHRDLDREELTSRLRTLYAQTEDAAPSVEELPQELGKV